MFFSQVVQRCERSFHNTQSFDPFLTSKISLNGALSTSHPFTFSLSMVLLYMMCLQEQSLIVSKRVLLYVEHGFFPKYFLNGFLWWKKVQERESYLFKKKKILTTTMHLTAIAKTQFCVFSKEITIHTHSCVPMYSTCI